MSFCYSEEVNPELHYTDVRENNKTKSKSMCTSPQPDDTFACCSNNENLRDSSLVEREQSLQTL